MSNKTQKQLLQEINDKLSIIIGKLVILTGGVFTVAILLGTLIGLV
jgi:hypothetical protein